jgi:hypothetical protein
MAIFADDYFAIDCGDGERRRFFRGAAPVQRKASCDEDLRELFRKAQGGEISRRQGGCMRDLSFPGVLF